MTGLPPGGRPDAGDRAPGDRAEQALRVALDRGAAGADFAPLDPAELALRARIRGAATPDAAGPARATPDDPLPDAPAAASAAGPRAGAHRAGGRRAGGRRRRDPRPLLAAAVVIALAVPAGWWALARSGGPVFSAGAGAAKDGSAAGSTAGRAADAAPVVPEAPGAPEQQGQQGPGASGTPSGDAPAGFRYESFLDVVVAVPASWGYAQAPGSDWCADTGTPAPPPATPYVTLNPNRAVLAILCPGAVPEHLQQTHLEWRRAASGDVDGDVTRNGWVYASRVVGAAFVTVVHRAGEDVDAILSSARRVAVDHHGCATTAPSSTARPAAAPAASEAGVAVTEAVLCQYDDLTASPDLVTSTRLTGAAASELAAAIAASPVAPGVAVEPECIADDRDVTRVVVRLGGAGASREVWLTLGGCRVPTFDDGTTYRTPTRAACTAALTPPLARWVWSAASRGPCGPA